MEKEKVLIFAHYYHPDVASTGQLLKELAEGMLNEFEVTVICVVPSYGGVIEEEYRLKKYYFENINGVKVVRVRVSEFTKEDKISRIKNILIYFLRALIAAGKVGKQDYVLTISQPPILGGLLGVLGKWIKRAKLIYCIQDFNPEQVIAINYSKNQLILKTMMWLDKFSCKQSDMVITVGRDLVETLKKRFKGKKVPRYEMINNWINESEIYPLAPDHERVAAFKNQYGLNGKFVIMYSGNIGLYYDLENLIKVVEKIKPGTQTADGREVCFAFVGAGAVLQKLKLYVLDHQMSNVVFIPYQDKADLIYSLNAGDVHWCINSKGIKGVSCPSKFYAQIAANRPVLGVLEKNSEIRILIEEIGCGLVCDPGDYDMIERNVRWFIDNAANGEVESLGKKGRPYLEENLTKSASIQKYIEVVKMLQE